MESNRYKNTKLLKPEEADKINEDALKIVEKAEPVLWEVEADPRKLSFHGPQTGSRWNSHYLSDAVNTIMEDLYGVDLPYMFEDLKDVPNRVKDFVRQTQKYREGMRFGREV